jgi:gamma-glutamylcyclotransferase (GGCT)/AIG2-like uncharacterized protein YtfP
MYLFVYGTLRRKQYNNYILNEHEFVGMGEVPGDLYIPPGYNYPKAVLSDDPAHERKIVVECYAIDEELSQVLDALELSHGYIKSNVTVDVKTLDGTVEEIVGEIYHVDPETFKPLPSRVLVPNGDFAAFVEQQSKKK